MILDYILFVIGFVLLIKGADMLVDGASALAKRFNVSNLVIGLTVVSFGTSAPELIVNLIASFKGDADLAVGNVLGSNIANILLILGVSAIIYPLTVQKNTVWKEIPFSLLAAIVLGFMVNDVYFNGYDVNILSRSEGYILLAFFVVFLYYTSSIARESSFDEELEISDMSVGKASLFIFLGMLGLMFGGDWIVDGAILIANNIGVSQTFIGLSVVAIGTSLPELATSAIAAYKRNTDIAIGNIVGSNIFNIFWILGVSSVIKPLPFNDESLLSLLLVIVSSLILFASIFVGRKNRIGKSEGIIFLIIYFAYLTYLFLGQQ